MNITEHFSEDEMKCKCCGKILIDQRLVIYLETLREKIKKPIIINSAYRCEKHNLEVGGAKESYHTKGMAADIYVKGLTSKQLANVCKMYGLFTGFGYGNNFLHVDVREGDICEWTY